MKLPYSLIAVFDDPKEETLGNISAVFLLEKPLEDETFQKIAADLNQPATTFLWPAEEDGHFHIRWFAPDAEIGLCGHGTHAATAFLTQPNSLNTVVLNYKNGQLKGQLDASGSCSIWIEPIPIMEELEITDHLQDALGVDIASHYSTNNKHIVVIGSEDELASMNPNFSKLRESKIFGYAVTAPGNEVDFVSRTIVPHVRQLEDHATGSSHAALTPFWSERLEKVEMHSLQLSPRKGKFTCALDESMVKLTGNFTTIANGEYLLQD